MKDVLEYDPLVPHHCSTSLYGGIEDYEIKNQPKQRKLQNEHSNISQWPPASVIMDECALGRGPDMTLVHTPPPPPHLSQPIFFEPLGCPEYEIGL